ncbi:phage tail sheath family protein [Streptomyces sp. UC4497]
MPGYQAPGVYVEEIVLGPTPLTGVSTSVTGLVGVARRGPVNKPTLVTGIGEYFRTFGDLLDKETYGDHRWLPYATQGFFGEGGQLAYILRVANLPPSGAKSPDAATFALTAGTVLPGRAGSSHTVLIADADEDAEEIELPYWSADLKEGTVIRLGDGPDAELVSVTGFNDQDRRIRIAPGLTRTHSAGLSVMRVSDSISGKVAELSGRPANTRGAKLLRVAPGAGLVNGRWVRVLDPPHTEFVRVEAAPAAAAKDVGIVPALRFTHPAGVAVAQAPAAAITGQLAEVAAGAGPVKVGAANPGHVANAWIVIDSDTVGETEAVRLESVSADELELRLSGDTPLRFSHAVGKNVSLLPAMPDMPDASTTLVGGLRLKAASGALNQGDVIVLNDGAGTDEIVQLTSAPAAAEPFDADIAPSFRFPHDGDAATVEIRKAVTPSVTTRLAAVSGLEAQEVTVADPAGFPDAAQDYVVEILDGANSEYASVSGAHAATKRLALRRPLQFGHAKGTPIRKLTPGLLITAGASEPDPELHPEPGAWGNEIVITVADSSVLTTKTKAAANQGDPFVELAGAGGIETGTVLRLPGNRYATVSRVQGRRAYVGGAGVPVGVAEGDVVATHEIDLAVSYAGITESFEGLSLDPAHSRYVERIVNRDSRIVHVASPGGAGGSPPLPGSWSPAGGSDGLGGIVPATFLGRDDPDADRRTGLFALLNEDEISIVAVPGEADEVVQRALISHCEQARYRFAVLDPVKDARLATVQEQRALYDSSYAALYYPHIQIFDTLGNERVYAPPSGHIAGLFGRTDSNPGVHKAPANATLRQATGLQFPITTGQQAVLNPRGINAVRAFPGRGIRVWGARTISSDALWQYVNVRRLFIYLEHSIDRGSQYAVFEPNDTRLWRRLKGSVTTFLTTVWRSGALQGTSEEEAFFVRVGLGESMTQADIDAGQVIILIGVAPVKPAEFVIFRIGQKAGGPDAGQ